MRIWFSIGPFSRRNKAFEQVAEPTVCPQETSPVLEAPLYFLRNFGGAFPDRRMVRIEPTVGMPNSRVRYLLWKSGKVSGKCIHDSNSGEDMYSV